MEYHDKYVLGHTLLSEGRVKEGFKSLFESACEDEHLGQSISRFNGKPLLTEHRPPATVFIHLDAGYGDNFLAMRYLPLLISQGYSIRYEITQDLTELVKYSFPQVEIVPRSSDFPKVVDTDFDCHLPINELPYFFKTDRESIPWDGPYLKADPSRAEKFKDHKGKIGICWNTCNSDDRSIPFEQLKPIISENRSRFVAVQRGQARLDNFRSDHSITDCFPLDERTWFWSNTAALIENLDLIISIDTSVAHLAGAMGKPVLLLMPSRAKGFRIESPGVAWNETTPWYPTVRIFRQRSPDEWHSAIESANEWMIKHVSCS